jgi:ubiquinone/menaquinone biosynthesis C-methylase UbiE
VDHEDFLGLFACPVCKTRLIHERRNLKCSSCNQLFPIIDGIVDTFLPFEGLKGPVIEFAERYERWGAFVAREESEIPRREATIALVEGGLLLEIGCAEGFMTAELTKKSSQVVASDIGLSYLKRAKANAPHAHFTRLDVHNIPFDENTFDYIICTEVLEHVLSPYRALNEINRVLKKDGFLVLSVPNNMIFKRIIAHLLRMRRSLTGFASAHINFYDTGSLLQLLEMTGFTANIVTTYYVPLPFVKGVLGKFAVKIFPYLGSVIIVKAKKGKIDHWERFDKVLSQRKTDKKIIPRTSM